MKHGSFPSIMGVMISFVRSGWQFVKGVRALSTFKRPLVTIFGGMRVSSDSPYMHQARTLATMFSQQGFAIITGGGPGIMQAAGCGAQGHTLGIAVKGVDEYFHNPCAPLIYVDHFFIRKLLMIRYSVGFVIFPGGIGTADEMFELLNYLKHGRMPKIPVILVGKEYWQPIITWFSERALKEGFIKKEYLELFMVTDDLDQICALIRASSNNHAV